MGLSQTSAENGSKITGHDSEILLVDRNHYNQDNFSCQIGFVLNISVSLAMLIALCFMSLASALEVARAWKDL